MMSVSSETAQHNLAKRHHKGGGVRQLKLWIFCIEKCNANGMG